MRHASHLAVRLQIKRILARLAAVFAVVALAGCATSGRRSHVFYSSSVGTGDAFGMWMGHQVKQHEKIVKAERARQEYLARAEAERLESERLKTAPTQPLANVPLPPEE